MKLVKDKVKVQVYNNVKEQIWGREWNFTWDLIAKQTSDEVWERIFDELWEEVSNQTRAKVRYRVEDQLKEEFQRKEHKDEPSQ